MGSFLNVPSGVSGKAPNKRRSIHVTKRNRKKHANALKSQFLRGDKHVANEDAAKEELPLTSHQRRHPFYDLMPDAGFE